MSLDYVYILFYLTPKLLKPFIMLHNVHKIIQITPSVYFRLSI